ncbi:hypothetical protein [Streptomyces sp. NPDC004783]|uniref:SCO2400 family protein n=1 Tax=Streptomyces sp. NPDC004783 TaxID=3154459 RepID=UPI0033A3BAEE
MDYCSTCRRHLNGALVCPGCGAYAPDIAPPHTYSGTAPLRHTTPMTTVEASGTAYAGQPTASGTGDDVAVRKEAELGPGTTTVAPAGVEGARPSGPGRAARRRQLARWKKNKRRAAVATAVAIVGGGLTVATLEGHSTDRARAATAPDDRSMGVAQERVPDRDQPAPAPPAGDRPSRTGSPVRAPGTATARQQPRATAASPAPTNDRSAEAAPPRPVTPSEPAPRTTAPQPSAPSAPDSSGTAAQPPAAPPATDRPETGASQGDPVPETTSPTEVCLLVLCLR